MRLTNVVGILAGTIAAVAQATAEPDWGALPYTPHAAFQAVDNDGFGTFPLTGPVKLRGVMLNWPEDLLDPTPGAPAFMGGQWQIYVQTVDAGDQGGVACWMGQLYGNLPWVPPTQSYTEAEWLAELARLNHDPVTGHAFAPGDLVEIRARAPGLHYGGKTNVNEQHSKDPLLDFDVLLLQAGYGLPVPSVVSLAALKDANDDFIFDPARQTGCERYQSELVRINGVTFVDATNWGPNADLLITDGVRTFPVKLGRNAGFSDHPAPSGPFDVIAILDQEDGDTSDGYKQGYRLWVTHYDGNGCTLPEVWALAGDTNCDGDVSWRDIDPLVDAIAGQANFEALHPCCRWLNGDTNGDGDVTWRDIDPFVALLSGP